MTEAKRQFIVIATIAGLMIRSPGAPLGKESGHA